MKIVIINQPWGNRGDESAHRALIRNLIMSFPEADIEIMAYDSSLERIKEFEINATNVKYTIIEAKPRDQRIFDLSFILCCSFLLFIYPNARKIIKIISSADVVVNAPGGICLGGFQVWSHLYLLKIAQKLHKPVAYYGRSIGPFPTVTRRNRIFKKLSYNILKYFGYLSLRDSKSVKLAENIGLNCISTVDTAFLDSPKVKVPFRIKKVIDVVPYMVFVPNSLVWHYAFKNVDQTLVNAFYLKLMNKILESDKSINIILLPQLHFFRSSDDKYYFDELMERCGNRRVEVIDDLYGSDVQQAIIQGAKYVVGARYHSVVFAINNAVPFVSLSYEHKMLGLLETLDKTENLIDITNIFKSEATVDSAVNKVLIIIESLRNENLENYESLREKAKEIANLGFDELKHYISLLNKR